MNNPGAIAFARMPYGAKFVASDFTICVNAASKHIVNSLRAHVRSHTRGGDGLTLEIALRTYAVWMLIAYVKEVNECGEGVQ